MFGYDKICLNQSKFHCDCASQRWHNELSLSSRPSSRTVIKSVYICSSCLPPEQPWAMFSFTYVIHSQSNVSNAQIPQAFPVKKHVSVMMIMLPELESVIHLHIYIFNSKSASHDNWCIETLLNRIITAQWEGMGDVGAARYEPALLPPCPTIRVLSYSNCQRSTHSISKWNFRNLAL